MGPSPAVCEGIVRKTTEFAVFLSTTAKLATHVIFVLVSENRSETKAPLFLSDPGMGVAEGESEPMLLSEISPDRARSNFRS